MLDLLVEERFCSKGSMFGLFWFPEVVCGRMVVGFQSCVKELSAVLTEVPGCSFISLELWGVSETSNDTCNRCEVSEIFKKINQIENKVAFCE